MGGTFPQILAYTSVPVATAVAGAAVAAWRPPPPALRSRVQHAAAGVVFAALAVELLPDVVYRRAPAAAAIGFAGGLALMLAIRAVVRRFEREGTPEVGTGGAAPAVQPKGSRSLVLVVGVDVLIDGLLLGIAFAAGERAGKLLAIALAAELLSLGLATAVELGRLGVPRGRSVAWTLALSLLLPAGAAAGAGLLAGLSSALTEAVLAFAAAALLYLVTEELLVEAHEVPETPPITATFFVGFLTLLLLDMIA